MRGLRKVPIDHGLSKAEDARASKGKTPPLFNRGDTGDLLEEQEQLHRESDWYGETDFGRHSLSEYESPEILHNLPSRSTNNLPTKRHDFSRERRERVISPPDRKRRRIEETRQRAILKRHRATSQIVILASCSRRTTCSRGQTIQRG